MRKLAETIIFLVFAGLVLSGTSAQATEFDHKGLCDASVAVAFDDDHFVVADDETNTLFIFRRGTQEKVGTLDLSGASEIPKNTKEMDLEGAARVGDRIYWIASHSKNQKRRSRFCTTEIFAGPEPGLKLPAKVQKGLLDALVETPQFDHFNLSDAAKHTDPARGGRAQY